MKRKFKVIQRFQHTARSSVNGGDLTYRDNRTDREPAVEFFLDNKERFLIYHNAFLFPGFWFEKLFYRLNFMIHLLSHFSGVFAGCYDGTLQFERQSRKAVIISTRRVFVFHVYEKTWRFEWNSPLVQRLALKPQACFKCNMKTFFDPHIRHDYANGEMCWGVTRYTTNLKKSVWICCTQNPVNLGRSKLWLEIDADSWMLTWKLLVIFQ